jgi:hypothetical protein
MVSKKEIRDSNFRKIDIMRKFFALMREFNFTVPKSLLGKCKEKEKELE